MRRSRIKWAVQVVTPWCLGMALLLSIAPDAGKTAPIGGTFLPLVERATAMPNDIVPIDPISLTGAFDSQDENADRLMVQASYDPGSSDDFNKMPDEVQPRVAPKNGPHAAPVIDRVHKGDPSIGLRPTFDTRLRRPGGFATLRESMMIAPHDDAMPAASFSLQDDGGPLDGATAFTPWAEGDMPEDAADLSARRGGVVIAMQPAAFKERLLQGATPKVGRAEALGSTTPAMADGRPVEVSFAAPAASPLPDTSVVAQNGHPIYASLFTGKNGAREHKCLAEAVYFESRSEPEEGQAAVAQVVLNRVTSGLYPPSVCGVVYQNRTHYKACQFSFACEGKSLRITEPEAWKTAQRVADDVVDGKIYVSDVGDATHYHAKYVRPGWARRLVKMDVIGHHIFYKLRPGQT